MIRISVHFFIREIIYIYHLALLDEKTFKFISSFEKPDKFIKGQSVIFL